MHHQDVSATLQEQVQQASADGQALELRAGGSKAFYGRNCSGQALMLNAHTGVIDYDPSELVISARAGTPLTIIEETLSAQGQMLAFEPPRFGDGATLGGTIACGFSGPRRPFAGSARDHVLGTRIINGKGETLSFGGKVMKNVAGYDLSRLMAGALGTLGVILDISLKVLPKPETETTLARECDVNEARELLARWMGKPLPLSAACYDGHRLFLRLSGAESAVAVSRKRLGAEPLDKGEAFWREVRELERPVVQGDAPLWRLSLPANTPALGLAGKALWDWAGCQRWLRSDEDPDRIRALAARAGGHATLFRGGDRDGTIFHPLPPAMQALQQRIKQSLDPQGIFNPGRLYADW